LEEKRKRVKIKDCLKREKLEKAGKIESVLNSKKKMNA
jgi:hypothetical protein